MAITSYSTLQTALANWSTRDDLTSILPDLIMKAEQRIRWGSAGQFPSRPLRARQMETRATLSLSGEYAGLPTDFLEPIKVKLNSDPTAELPYIGRVAFDETFNAAATGKPRAYTIVGTEMRFGPSPDTSYTAELWYYKDLTALSTTNTTNWLLTAAPHIYLSGSLVELYAYIKEYEEASVWLGDFAGAIEAFADASWASRLGVNLRMRPHGVTP